MTSIVIPNVFLPSTTISSTAMNANFQEVVDGLAASLALDGSDTMTGQVRLAPGTAAAPALAFGADLNLGLYRRGVDNLGFSSAGVLAGHIDSAGKWWIITDLDVGDDLDVGGDATVDATLTVTGASTFTGNLTAGVVLPSSIELGHASDTTITRPSAGDIAVEGNIVYRAGGTDVAVADGGTGASTAAAARTSLGVAGAPVQRVYTQATSFTTSSNIPADGTNPQITEGAQVLTASITPTNAANRIRVRVQATFTITSAGERACMALFNGGAGAIALSSSRASSGTNNINNSMGILFEQVAGGVGAITFSVRAGASGGDLSLATEFGSTAVMAAMVLEEIHA